MNVIRQFFLLFSLFLTFQALAGEKEDKFIAEARDLGIKIMREALLSNDPQLDRFDVTKMLRRLDPNTKPTPNERVANYRGPIKIVHATPPSPEIIAWVRFLGADNTIYVSDLFFSAPKVIAAGILIHEINHIALNNPNDCKADAVTSVIQRNSVSSEGYLSAQYMNCDVVKNMVIGLPIILKKPGNYPIVFNRARDWIGGNKHLKKYPGDLNEKYQVSIEQIIEADLPDELIRELRSK